MESPLPEKIKDAQKKAKSKAPVMKPRPKGIQKAAPKKRAKRG
jgi:hypothetical protein